MWRETLINPDTSIIKAIEIIDRTGLQIALVVDEEGRLLGTVTDGDIRRGILKHLGHDEPVAKVMNPDPCFISQDQSRENALLLMKNMRLHQIPILDRQQRVVGLEIADDLMNSPTRRNTVVLMAGGLGRRLQPLTEQCPKPMLKVGDKPLLETIMEGFIDQGFRIFYISVHYKADIIMRHFGNGSRWAVKISYLHETKPLGTAGALGILPEKPQEPMLMMNGDILTRINLAKLLDFHKNTHSIATICIKEYSHQLPYGVVTIGSNRVKKIDEKPIQKFFINGGLYVFNPEVLEYIPADSYLDVPDLLKILLQQGKEVAAFPIREYWIDIGRSSDYERATQDYKKEFL